MSSYLTEQQPTLADNKFSSLSGIGLLFPKTTINGSSFDNNNINNTMPITIEPDSLNKEKQYTTMLDVAHPSNTLVDQNGSDSDSDSDVDDEDDYIGEYKQNYVAQFYIGSLTIVGLYIFFRLIKRSR